MSSRSDPSTPSASTANPDSSSAGKSARWNTPPVTSRSPLNGSTPSSGSTTSTIISSNASSPPNAHAYLEVAVKEEVKGESDPKPEHDDDRNLKLASPAIEQDVATIPATKASLEDLSASSTNHDSSSPLQVGGFWMNLGQGLLTIAGAVGFAVAGVGAGLVVVSASGGLELVGLMAELQKGAEAAYKLKAKLDQLSEEERKEYWQRWRSSPTYRARRAEMIENMSAHERRELEKFANMTVEQRDKELREKRELVKNHASFFGG